MKRIFIYILFLYLGNALLFPSFVFPSTLRLENDVEYEYNYDAGKLKTPDYLEYPFVAQPGNGSYTVKLDVTFHFDIWNNGAFDLLLINMDTHKEIFCREDQTLTKFPAGNYLFRINYSNSSAANYKVSMIISQTSAIEGYPPMGGAESGIYHNYIISKTFTNESGTESQDIINYYDGLGRPEQTVAKAASPTRNDLITITEYNRYGQQTHEWLPAVLDNGGAFTRVDIVKASSAYWNEDTTPYTKRNTKSLH